MVMQVHNAVAANEARVNVTWANQNGDLADVVPVDATDDQIRTWAAESVHAGSVLGIGADPAANFANFVVDRFPPTDVRPYNLLSLRPKTPFGA